MAFDHGAAARSRIADWRERIAMMEDRRITVGQNGQDVTEDFIAELRRWIAEDEKLIAHVEGTGRG